MIELKNIKKGFGEKTVLNGVNANMTAGKCNLIIGASGSGKTVLMVLDNLESAVITRVPANNLSLTASHHE